MNLIKQQLEWKEKTLSLLKTKLQAEISRTGTALPYIPVNGRYRDCLMPGGAGWWTNGFWPGILWQMAEFTKDEHIRQTAKETGRRILTVLDDPASLDHDIGFLFVPSVLTEYRLTKKNDLYQSIMKAADLLAGRFRTPGNYIEAWNEGAHGQKGNGNSLIADCMMNLSLLYHASEFSGDPKYAETADAHAHTALKLLLREDGSANHIVKISPLSGEVTEIPAGQGYASGSSWSRGQGWILYGFANAYSHTGKPEYLAASKRSANYCVTAMAAADWLPKVDFRAPMDDGRYDSTGGMVIASGLLKLAQCLPAEEQEIYRSAAIKILTACEKRFADWDPENDGIMGCGATMYHNDRLGDRPVMYTDYFFLEAMLRLNGNAIEIW